MKKIVLNKTKYLIPESYSELKLGVYEQLQNLPLDSEIETDYKIKYLSILTGVDESIVEQVVKEDIDNLWLQTGWLSSEPENNSSLKQMFKVNGKQYYFLNDLTEDTTIEAFVDMLKIYTSVPSFWHAAPGILAPIIRLVKHIEYDYSMERMRKLKGREKYNKNNYIKKVILEDHDSSNVDVYAEDLKHLYVQDVSAVAFFLSHLYNELLSQILNNYSKVPRENPLLSAKVNEMARLWNKITKENLDGMKQ